MEGNLFIYIMPQIKAGKSENPAIAQQHFRANKKSDQPKLVALTCFGGPSGGRTLDLGIKSPLLYQLS